MILSFIHRLIKPIITWHSDYKAAIVAEWLEKYDPAMTTAVWMFRESQKSEVFSSTTSVKKATRRRALRKLRSACSDPAVRRAIQKRFPPLPRTWG